MRDPRDPTPMKPVWTTYRKLMGNLIGMAAMAIVVVAGFGLGYGSTFGEKAAIVLVALVVGLIVFHYTGLFQNARMRTAMAKRAERLPEWEGAERFFVGYATRGYAGALDPHEDVGWLLLSPDELVFEGERYRFRYPRRGIGRVGRSFGVHSLVGVSWVSAIAVADDGAAASLRFESRDADHIFSLRRANLRLRKSLQVWQQTGNQD
jgi:hypothetical protein